MTVPAATFEERLAAARVVEKGVATWLMRAGWHVLATADFSGEAHDQAPALRAANDDEELVMPDLLVCARGSSRWAEIKLKKTSATWTTSTNRFETGFSLRLWRHYQRVEHESGIPVHLLFLHRHEDEVRGASLAFLKWLGPRIYEGNRMASGGMVFFPYASLPLLAKVTDVLPEHAA